MAGILILETDMVRKLQGISPPGLIYNRNTGRVSNEIGLHKSLCITVNSFLGNI